jgi:hypothetical protein
MLRTALTVWVVSFVGTLCYLEARAWLRWRRRSR